MDKSQALYSFWSGFGIPAIDEQSAYDDKALEQLDIDFPYITFEVQTSNLGEPVALTASLWYRSPSWGEITRKSDEIAAYIGYGGKVLPVDGGYIWIMLGAPFAQRMAVEDDGIRRIVMNITVDFLTAV